jgi:hypothetical protein
MDYDDDYDTTMDLESRDVTALPLTEISSQDL